VIRTHPSGRGKMGYWPNWVLDRCQRIVELQRQGHSLQSAVLIIEQSRLEQTIKSVTETPSLTDILERKRLKTQDGREFTLFDLFVGILILQVKEVVANPEIHEAIILKVREQKLLDLAVSHLARGYNPVFVLDGAEAWVAPDFMLAQHLSYVRGEPRPRTLVVVPLLAPLRKAFSAIGRELPGSPPHAYPAPKIWVKDGDALMEYDIYPLGPDEFELIRETARTIGGGETPSRAETEA
jgi:hypothetical protein